jgi:hypothetical protein
LPSLTVPCNATHEKEEPETEIDFRGRHGRDMRPRPHEHEINVL